MNFNDALQLILVSVCTGFGLELAKEFAQTFIAKIKTIVKKAENKLNN